MKYKSLVQPNSNFQTSVNLQFDLHKINKIEAYIPTTQSVSILKKYLNAVYNDSYNEDNATILIGPYGRGKSHLLLILASLMTGIAEEDVVKREALNKLISKLEKIDRETGKIARLLLKRNKPVLTVMINSNHIDINQSFILGLREALERENLTDFFPQTYFDSALSMIATWENDYENAFSTLKKLLKEKKTSLSKIKNELNQCSKTAYHLFCDIYPEVTNGAEFNPMQNTDIVKTYTQVSEALAEQKNYGGIFIIFDEFSKFLESSAVSKDMQNLKIIQDFAELATRNSQIQLCCVTHKEILDYSQNENFRTVDGRFKKVYFVASAEQSYELVANVLKQKRSFQGFYKEHEDLFAIVSQNAYRTGIFNELTEETYHDLIMKGCFPLHPMTVYALIRISEKVGQNERTLFTFLSQSEEHTLQTFINQEFDEQNLYFMTPDYIFDYFSELFRIEIFNPKIHNIWSKANAALRQTDDENQHKILKTMAVINIIGEENLPPVPNLLKASVHLDDESFDIAITALQQKHILAQQHNHHFVFLTPNGVDIRQTINNYIEQGLVRLNRPEILQSAYFVSYLLPRQYNADKCMMRYFRTMFMELEDFQAYQGNFEELCKDADGLIVYLIRDIQDMAQVNEKLHQLQLPENILICVSESWVENDLLMEYAAACMLEHDKLAEDIHFREELYFYKEDIFKSIQEKVNHMYSPLNPSVVYYKSAQRLESIISPLLLNRELSAICFNYYPAVPIINNEMINKNNPTPQIRKARIKLIDWLLNYPEQIPMMEGYGPEVSLLRSTIFVKGLHENHTSDDEFLNQILNRLKEKFLDGMERTVDFSEIYDTLMKSPYGIRKGVIPIYMAWILRQYKDNFILYYEGKEVHLTGDIFENIEKMPDKYYFKIEQGTAERENYLDRIIETFSSGNQNTTLNKRQSAVNAIQAWFRGLPKFSRDSMYYYTETPAPVSDAIKKLRKKTILFDLNPYEFLFEFVPEIFDYTENFDEIVEKLTIFKTDTEKFIMQIKKYLIAKIKPLFHVNIDGSLCSILNEWYETLPEKTKKNVFSADVNTFLKVINENSQFDDMEIVTKLAKNINLIALEDWNDEKVTEFINHIQKMIQTIENYHHATAETDENVSIAISFSDQVYEKNISDTEIAGLAETAMSNIESILEDYGEAISAQERIAVLLQLLKKEFEQL